MNIQEINEIIKELEFDEINPSNVQNLACLYIIRDELNKSNTTQSDASERELDDILPAYKYYQDVKRKYQLKIISDDALVPAMKFVTQELKEFISSLYNNTYFRKERVCIECILKELNEEICC